MLALKSPSERCGLGNLLSEGNVIKAEIIRIYYQHLKMIATELNLNHVMQLYSGDLSMPNLHLEIILQ